MSTQPLEKHLPEGAPVIGVQPVERTPSTAPEQREQAAQQEQEQNQLEVTTGERPQPERDTRRPARAVPQAPTIQQAVQKDIENILSEDLGDLYRTMTPEQQKKFRTRGEEIAAKVTQLVLTAKARFRDIWSLVRAWLGMIPGVNKLFLEQESKIKTDQLIKYAQEDVRKRVEEQYKK